MIRVFILILLLVSNSLFAQDVDLLVTTYQGGEHAAGEIFSINTKDGNRTNIYEARVNLGQDLLSNLVCDGQNLYGITNTPFKYQKVLFSHSLEKDKYKVLHIFNDIDSTAERFNCYLHLNNNNQLYGTCNNQLFRLNHMEGKVEILREMLCKHGENSLVAQGDSVVYILLDENKNQRTREFGKLVKYSIYNNRADTIAFEHLHGIPYVKNIFIDSKNRVYCFSKTSRKDAVRCWSYINDSDRIQGYFTSAFLEIINGLMINTPFRDEFFFVHRSNYESKDYYWTLSCTVRDSGTAINKTGPKDRRGAKFMNGSGHLMFEGANGTPMIAVLGRFDEKEKKWIDDATIYHFDFEKNQFDSLTNLSDVKSIERIVYKDGYYYLACRDCGTYRGQEFAENTACVFQLDEDFEVVKHLFSFSETENARYITRASKLRGNNIIGVSSNGGRNDQGVIFKVNKNGKKFKRLAEAADLQLSDLNLLALEKSKNGKHYGVGQVENSEIRTTVFFSFNRVNKKLEALFEMNDELETNILEIPASGFLMRFRKKGFYLIDYNGDTSQVKIPNEQLYSLTLLQDGRVVSVYGKQILIIDLKNETLTKASADYSLSAGDSYVPLALVNDKVFAATMGGDVGNSYHPFKIYSSDTLFQDFKVEYSHANYSQGSYPLNFISATNGHLYGVFEDYGNYGFPAIFEFNPRTKELRIIYKFDRTAIQLGSISIAESIK